MDVLVPFSSDRPKTRLSDTLDPDERDELARAMLVDVVSAVRKAGGSPHVLATDDDGLPVDAPVTVDERALTPAVNDALDDRRVDGPVAVVMSDLALATADALDRLFAAGREADVAIAPGRGGGTNALVVDHPDFAVDYHGVSYLDHRDAAAAVGATVRVVDSHRLATDVDERADLAELLIHGSGTARDWLADAGFELAVEGGRVGVRRE